jgi:tetratricopeptide (TPR) repeat protein
MTQGPDVPSEPDAPTLPVLERVRILDEDRRLGPYRILRPLGQGGMGTVYLGVRADRLYDKLVAIKVIRGADREEVVRLFHRERRILATLDHPNIAKLLDGGTTEEGFPYFVMEYVEGQHIDVYGERQELSTLARVRLFLDVCAAVQYAHRNLVVHRDLKPANILVDASGTVKLLDFGIAKLLDPDPRAESPSGTHVAMTPDYASPEQARGEAMTTATDVYSLGVVLYELLTGHRPYRLRSRHPSEALRALLEDEPERPSTAVDRRPETDGRDASHPLPTPESVSRPRDGTPERLKRRLRGDLDNIVLMAIRKEPHKRYSSVEAFAEDLTRHLQGQPVSARQATIGYRAGKFMKRHAWGVASVLAVTGLIAASMLATARQAKRVRLALENAEHERAKAEAVSSFLVDLFKVSDPSEARGKTVTAREVLDKGAARVGTELKDQPELRATLEAAIGDVYRSLGHLDTAVPILQEALLTRRQLLGNDHPDVAATLTLLGQALHAKGDFAGAARAHEEALAIRRRVLPPDHLDVATSLTDLGNALTYSTRDYARVEALHREALAIRRKQLGSHHPDVVTTLGNVAGVLREKGQNDEAVRLLREVLDLRTAMLGREHPLVASSLNNLAVALAASGHVEESERLYREALALRRKLLGPDNTQVGTVLHNLGILLCEKDDAAGAEALLREALRIQRQALGDDNPRTASSMASLGDTLLLQGKLPEAEQLYRDALRIMDGKVPPHHPLMALTKLWLGKLLVEKRDLSHGEREALAIHRENYPPGDPRLAEAESALGECLAALGRRAEAGPLLERGYTALKAARGDTRSTKEAYRRLSSFRQGGEGGPPLGPGPAPE